MILSRIVVRLPLALAIAVVLTFAGCDDQPEVPPEVQELARQREEAEQQAREELEQKRRDGRLIQPSDEPPTKSPPPVDSPPATGPDRRASTADNAPDDAIPDTPSEEIVPPATPTSPLPPRKSAAALRWAQVKAGMSAKEVVALLGSPSRVEHDVYLDYWYYGQGRAAGRIAVIRGSQRSIAWDPPID